MKKLMIIPVLLFFNTVLFAHNRTIEIVKPVANITDTIPPAMSDSSRMMNDTSGKVKMKRSRSSDQGNKPDKTKNKMKTDTTSVRKDNY